MPLKRAPTTARTIDDFIDKILVVCPGCSKMAVVLSSGQPKLVRLVCELCGLARSEVVASYSLGNPEDPYFGLPLWLRTSCATNTLWAYNWDHLAFLKRYVEAANRRRPARTSTDPLNRLLVSRLPRWMQLSKNRDQVLRAIAVLEATKAGRLRETLVRELIDCGRYLWKTYCASQEPSNVIRRSMSG